MSVDDFTQEFILRHNESVGVCSALYLNQKLVKSEDLEASVFLCVSGKEEIEQVVEMLEKCVGKKFGNLTFTANTLLWFAPISLYQPKLNEQLQFDGIFKYAMIDCKAFFAIQTAVVDAFTDVWCLRQLESAVQTETPMHFILSQDWITMYVREVTLGHTYDWYTPSDGDAVYRKILYTLKTEVGEEPERVLLTRQEMTKEIKQGGHNFTKHNDHFPSFRSYKYHLMEKDEWALRETPDVSGTVPVRAQPVLRANVKSVSSSFSFSPKRSCSFLLIPNCI